MCIRDSLCGLYGVLRPYDEIRPYRLEMSTKLSCPGNKPNLYQFWGEALTESIEAEKPGWVLNAASQEYAKSISFKALSMPVITAAFPGPAVHAKQARGELVRFCAEARVTKPEELRSFRGSGGLWRFIEGESDDSTYVFHRGAAAPKASSAKASGAKASGAKASAAEPAGGKRKQQQEEEEPATGKRRGRPRKS